MINLQKWWDNRNYSIAVGNIYLVAARWRPFTKELLVHVYHMDDLSTIYVGRASINAVDGKFFNHESEDSNLLNDLVWEKLESIVKKNYGVEG